MHGDFIRFLMSAYFFLFFFFFFFFFQNTFRITIKASISLNPYQAPHFVMACFGSKLFAKVISWLDMQAVLFIFCFYATKLADKKINAICRRFCVVVMR